jgi:hypothetical protein
MLFKFEEARAKLKAGSHVLRKSWNDGSYIVLMPGMPLIWKIITLPSVNAGTWMATMDDMEADDWMTLADFQAEAEKDRLALEVKPEACADAACAAVAQA